MGISNASVPALERSLNILEYIASASSPVSVKFLAETLDIPATSVFRLVKNLEARGYLLRHPGEPATYSLGEKLISLAIQKRRGESISTLADPFMRTLASQTGQTVQLAVLKNDCLMYIHQVLAPNSTFNITAPLYTSLNLHTSAAGKILFSYLPEEHKRALCSKLTFPAMTKHTILTPEQFYTETELCHQLGYGRDNEEYAIGVGCIAVPIFDDSGCAAAIGLTGPISEYQNPARFELFRTALDQAAHAISHSLQFTSST